ncbi:MAG: hypothetical protein AAF198_11965 [Pseudomonadota bacterium]
MTQRFTKTYWLHSLNSEPSLLLADENNGWSVRLIEIFSDGRLQYVSETEDPFNRGLPDQPAPRDDDIDENEFVVFEIQPSEFEDAWTTARARLNQDAH